MEALNGHAEEGRPTPQAVQNTDTQVETVAGRVEQGDRYRILRICRGDYCIIAEAMKLPTGRIEVHKDLCTRCQKWAIDQDHVKEAEEDIKGQYLTGIMSPIEQLYIETEWTETTPRESWRYCERSCQRKLRT